MKKLAELLHEYGQYHTQRITKITHYVGVPLLIFAIMIFLGWIHIAVPNIFEINLAWIGVIALLVYYFKLDFWLAAGLAVILILMTFISNFFSQPIVTPGGVIVFLFTFILGLAAQIIGHLQEKKKPALFRDLRLALIAPLYLFTELMFALGYRKDLQSEMKRNS